jgi:hypothetical protein
MLVGLSEDKIHYELMHGVYNIKLIDVSFLNNVLLLALRQLGGNDFKRKQRFMFSKV